MSLWEPLPRNLSTEWVSKMSEKRVSGSSSIKILLAEVILISLVGIGISYYFEPKDPLRLKTGRGYFDIIMAVLTLFYGFKAGMILILINSAALLLFYKVFPYKYLLWQMLFMLIYSEFHFFWNKKILRLSEENKYLNEKLDNKGYEFFLLKASYDQIVKNYVIKPVSIRSLLGEIKERFAQKDENIYQWLLFLLRRVGKVEKASLYVREGARFVERANLGERVELDKNDPIVRKAMEHRNILFHTVAETNATKYKAVIPVFPFDEVEPMGLLLIREIPFLSLNRDNLMLLSIILNYFFEEIRVFQEVHPLRQEIKCCSERMLYEAKKMYSLWKKMRIESTIMKISVRGTEWFDTLREFIEKNVRTIDVFYSDSSDIMLILLPLTSLDGAIAAKDRLSKLARETFGKKVQKLLDFKVIPVKMEVKKLFKEVLS